MPEGAAPTDESMTEVPIGLKSLRILLPLRITTNTRLESHRVSSTVRTRLRLLYALLFEAKRNAFSTPMSPPIVLSFFSPHFLHCSQLHYLKEYDLLEIQAAARCRAPAVTKGSSVSACSLQDNCC